MAIIKLSEKDNDTKITCSKGDIVAIDLKWQPSNGFFWQESDTTAATLLEIIHDVDEPKPDTVPGPPLTVRFKFKIVSKGVIKLCLARPWDELGKPAKWFEVSVELF